jgi:uncharacterized membrane protein YkvA (DUF1232 family)
VIDKLKRWARELKAQLMTLWFCRSHPDTPLIAKISAALVLAYAFSPIDLIPDFIPVLGYLDDLIIVPAGIYLTLRLIPEGVKAQSRLRAEAWMAQHQAGPKNYFAAAIIVLIWLAIAYWAYWAWKELMP